MPFFCYNKDDYCDHSENCDGCDVWVRGKGGKEVPSNADRIRAMTDEELAKHFSGMICDINEGVEYHESPNIWLEWLQQPVGEEPR